MSTTESTPFQKRILFALQDRPLYGGTVPAHVIAKRRAAGKVAKASRKQNRGR
ncbi:MAG TPA: hypothetical protein VMV41_10105 [Cellulomonadaceae bacterium]|nr:hypothetical protein [Cellulomonadaceae bacterium]